MFLLIQTQECAQYRERITQLFSTITRLEERVVQTNSLLENEKSRASDLSAQLVRSTSQLEISKAAETHALQALEDLRSQNNKLTRTLSDLQDIESVASTQLLAERERLLERSLVYNQTISDLKRELEEIKLERNAVQARKDLEGATMMEKIEILSRDFGKVSGDLAVAKLNEESLKEKCALLESRLSALSVGDDLEFVFFLFQFFTT